MSEDILESLARIEKRTAPLKWLWGLAIGLLSAGAAGGYGYSQLQTKVQRIDDLGSLSLIRYQKEQLDCHEKINQTLTKLLESAKHQEEATRELKEDIRRARG